MAESMKRFGTGSLAMVFVLGLGLGWLGASRQALVENRARDAAGFEQMRQRLAEESMRRLDLSPEQRQIYIEAWEDGHREFGLALGALRPTLDEVLRRIDDRVRPVLSPRQLAAYDRIEAERRGQMPERPVGSDN